ncbi:MAG: 4'-phosphopantetheinyl transferase superfamily protein [Desulfobulbaceae bacterium]|nr:4'-phosphopantetheinyl transferase superfamily protein [Desulfobulbaceae bacterium]
MAKDSRGINVHAVNFDHRGGPAFYGSLPGDGETRKGSTANAAGKRDHLVSILLDHVVAQESPLWKCFHSCNRDALPIRVVHGPLGRPRLLAGEYRMPGISFSEGGGKVWAALCGDESDIGIDAAAFEEFRGEYPLHRVFHDQELQHALKLTGGDVARAAALLWSVKEAVVKALGCGFHLVAPRQVRVYPSTGEGRGYSFPVGLSGKALVRFPKGADRSIWVRSFPGEQMWLSIVLLNWRSRL